MRSTGKNILILTLTIALLLSMLPVTSLAAGVGDVLQDNFVRITTSDCFSKGTLDSLTVSAEYGNGALTLTEGASDGVYESPELTVPAFEYLVASWSADTPVGTYVEISGRAYVDMKSGWSDWLSWGKWSPYIKRGSTGQKDSFAQVDTDTFTVLGSNGETASKIQLRVTLHTDDASVTPVFRELCCTMKNTLDGQAIPVWHGDADAVLPESVVISEAPAISQSVRDRDIADSICSPTTVTMLLNARGEDLLPEEIALREYDFFYEGFGNWPFTVAMAGAFGYTGYCHYGDFDFLRQELACGRTVGLSVKYSNTPDGGYPYLENAPISGTGGHLISIVGYGVEDGVNYFYSNDSAASSDSEAALRKYKEEQLSEAWSGRLCYVISSEKEANAGFAAPQRIEATLEYTGADGLYNIMVDGAPISGLAANFSAKTAQLGAGAAILVADDAEDTSAEGTASCLATHKLQYLTVSSKGELRANNAPAGTVYIVVNNGPTYVVHLDPVAATAAPASPAPTDQSSSGTWYIWVILGAAAVAAAAVIFLRLRGRTAKPAAAKTPDTDKTSTTDQTSSADKK